MRLNEYQQLAMASRAKGGDALRFSATKEMVPLEFAALGLAGEAGELANLAKKNWRDQGRTSGTGAVNTRRADMVDELGDVLWYAAQLATLLRADLGDVAEANLRKLGVIE